MEILIRKAEDIDAPAIAGLLQSLGLFARITAEDPQATRERVAKYLTLTSADDSHLVLVAQAPDGEIAGYCAVHWLPYLILSGPEGYVSELFIREEFRGQGIGGQLLEAIKVAAQQHGCSRLMLLNMRQRASYQRQFYLKHGWQERTEAANFILEINEL